MGSLPKLSAGALAVVVPLLLGAVPADGAGGGSTRVSVSTYGTQGNEGSSEPEISADGRLVAFTSAASNLVRGDTNGAQDVFVRDRRTGTTSRVSVSNAGTQSNGSAINPSISADGRFVAFLSDGSNLVPRDINRGEDVFVRDRHSGRTILVSVSSGGTQGHTTKTSFSQPVISADGRFVIFASYAADLVPGDTNDKEDVFLHDRRNGTTSRVSLSNSGRQANGQSGAQQSGTASGSISADGRFVAFTSQASNLVPGDTNQTGDVFVRDLQNRSTSRLSVSSAGAQGDANSFAPELSLNGRFVVFVSYASNFASGDEEFTLDVFFRDRRNDTASRVSVSTGGTQGNSGSGSPSVSADGRFVVFESNATNLVPGDSNGEETDVFLRDRRTGITSLVSVSSGGTQANSSSFLPAISADGRFVAFESFASNLVPRDTNNINDVFVRDLGAPDDTPGEVQSGAR